MKFISLIVLLLFCIITKKCVKIEPKIVEIDDNDGEGPYEVINTILII